MAEPLNRPSNMPLYLRDGSAHLSHLAGATSDPHADAAVARGVAVGGLLNVHRLVGLVVKASASRAEDLGFESRLPQCRIFSGSSHTSDLKTGTPVATPPGAWRYRVSAGTGRPGVSIL